jgi:hypothetical protein
MAHAANSLELLDDVTAQRAALGLGLGFHRASSVGKASTRFMFNITRGNKGQCSFPHRPSMLPQA